MKRFISILLVVLFMLAACTPAVPQAEGVDASETTEAVMTATTESPATLAPTEDAPIATTEETPSGVPVNANGIAFTLPFALGNGAANSIMPADIGEDRGGFAATPAYMLFTLEGYPYNEADYFTPMLKIYRASEYVAIINGGQMAYDNAFNMITNTEAEWSKPNMPQLPVNAALTVGAGFEHVGFQGGSGVRMLSTYSQGLSTVTNRDLIYQYVGLTTDFQYVVEAIFPVNAPFLPDDYESALPEGGVAFPEDPAAFETYIAQIDALVQDAVNNNTISPSIVQLDALIQSLTIDATQFLLPVTDISTILLTEVVNENDPAVFLGSPAWIDTFDNVTTKWQYSDDHARYEVSEGYLNISAMKDANWHTWYVTTPKVQNAYLEMTVEFQNCAGNDRLGMAFRGPETSQFYFMGITCDGQWGFYQMGKDAQIYELLGYRTAPEFDTGFGARNRVGVWMQDSQYIFYINGIQVGEATDSAYTASGMVGFVVAYGQWDGFTVKVDQLAYWDLP